MRIERIIFDFDDTLCLTSRFRKSLLMERVARTISVDAALSIERTWGSAFWRELEAEMGISAFQQFLTDYRQDMQKNPTQLVRGAREFLLSLEKKGVSAIVVSASLTTLVEQDLLQTDIRRFISEVYGSDRTVFPKPDFRCLQKVETRCAAMVGDSIADCILARAWALQFFAVTTNVGREQFLMEGVESDFIVDSLDAIQLV